MAHGYLLSCFAGYLASRREQLLNLLSLFVLQQKTLRGDYIANVGQVLLDISISVGLVVSLLR